MTKSPLAIDLYCGLGGWAEGLLGEGWNVVGFDIEQHDYGTGGYPGQLVIQDVTTLHGSQFKNASLIVASPPCQAYSYRAMPWSRAKALPPPDNTLFETCFRIQREAEEAAGHHIPLIVENVRGAQKWVGRAKWAFGSFCLWGDVPALMPITLRGVKTTGRCLSKGAAAKWGTHNMGPGDQMHAEIGTNQRESDGVKWGGCNGERFDERPKGNIAAHREGTKQPGISGTRDNGKGDKWFQDGAARHGSKSNSRKAASAMIAKIPLPLSQHIAQVFKVARRGP